MRRNAHTRAAPSRSRHDFPAQDDMAYLQNAISPAVGDAFRPRCGKNHRAAYAGCDTHGKLLSRDLAKNSKHCGIRATVSREEQKLKDEGGFRRKIRQGARAS